MRYNINARLIFDAEDGTLTLPGEDQADSQLTLTASALLVFFLLHTGLVSREEVLKRVWDENNLTSSNSNLNQYLSMLRKTFRHYDIENVIVTVPRGYLQLNPDISVELLQACTETNTTLPPLPLPSDNVALLTAASTTIPPSHTEEICWHIASVSLLIIALLLVFGLLIGDKPAHIPLTPLSLNQCELLASKGMLQSVAASVYISNFDHVRQRLDLACKPDKRFMFFYGDRLETLGLGRVFLAHCAMHKDNPFGYCDNYFYYSWKVS